MYLELVKCRIQFVFDEEGEGLPFGETLLQKTQRPPHKVTNLECVRCVVRIKGTVPTRKSAVLGIRNARIYCYSLDLNCLDLRFIYLLFNSMDLRIHFRA